MRAVAAILYVLVLCSSSLGIQGGALKDYASFSFDLPSASWETYRDFLATLRESVKATPDPKKNIPPVLRPEDSVPVGERFVLAHLNNYEGNTVTLAVDVVNLDVVAFSGANNKSYFFNNATQIQTDNLFVNTTQTKLPFDGDYNSLENAAGVTRDSIPLGLTPLDDAITLLCNGESVAKSLIVVIQMVSEAARFRYIEEQVRRSISGESTFTPSGLILSMENEWSTMSLEVQRALDGVVITRSVQLLEDYNFSTIEVENINRLSRYTMVALLLYRCPANLSSPAGPIIRMPVALAGEDYDPCIILETTRPISGLDGYCVDVRNGTDNDTTPVQLSTCGDESSQRWTFHTDGTIRSMGKCMAASDYVMIFNCSEAFPDTIKWVVSIDGSITNPPSGLVLTAPPAATPGTTLLVENNTYEARQGWSVGNVQPLVTYIVGLNELCLQVNDEKTAVWLEECVVDRQQQQWALFGDGTIRVYNDSSRCVTSDGYSSGALINIFNCEGLNNQRWVFNSTDLTILSPYAKLVLDVKDSNVTDHKIILHEPTGNPGQQWLTPVRIYVN